MSRFFVLAIVVAVLAVATANHHNVERAEVIARLNAQKGMTWLAGVNSRFMNQVGIFG